MSTMRAVYSNLRAARTAIKDVGRLRQIARVLVRHGLGYVVQAWNLQDKFIVNLLVEKRDETLGPPPDLFERICVVLQELGPTFVKLGQILSTRPDLVPAELCDQLKKLQDDVVPIAAAEARGVLEASLGRPVDAVFGGFDDAHLASASIAQVHTATLDDGAEVVVKIQRPGIADTIQSDLNILYWVAKQIEQTIPEAEAFDPVSIAREFDKAITKELDFNYEANNLERFQRNFDTDEWRTVHIPQVYRDLSSKTVLVMERLRAVKITDAGQYGHDMDAIAKECVRMLLKQVYEDGFFHGDLHPGNLLIMEDGRIGLIDFGLVGRMTPPMKDRMAELFLNLITQNYEGLARNLYDISRKNGPIDYSTFEADVCELADKNFGSASLADVDFGIIVRDLIEGAIRHNLRIPPDYTMFFKALMTVEGIGKIVSPNLDLLEESRPHIEAIIKQRYSPDRMLKAAVDTGQAFVKLSRQFPVTAHQFLAQIEDGKLSLGQDPKQFAAIEAAKARRFNRGVLTAGAGTMLLAGVILHGLKGIEVISFPTLLYLGSAVVGFRVWWRVRGEDW